MRVMAYAFDSLKVVVSVVLLAGCTGENPLFQIDEGTDTGGGTQQSAGETTSVTPTSEGPTSEGPTSAGPTGDVTTSMGPGSDATTGAASSGGQEETSAPETSGTSEPSTVSDGSSGSSGMNMGGCGDGVKDEEAGEECDSGAENGNGGECTAECTLNECGDKYQGPGEECDDGEENGEGNACKEGCKLNVCGDGDQGPEEVCDAGAMNGQVHPGCSHDCKVEISILKKRHICTTPALLPGNFEYSGKVGLAGADLYCTTKCGPTYKAMVAAEGRVASMAPYAGKEASWVVEPYTAYYRWMGGPLVFMTGEEGLLGVVKGADAPLINPIGNESAWTGLKTDWTNAGENCMGWMKADANNKGMVGKGGAQVGGEYIAKEPQGCNLKAAVYCVEHM